MRVESSFAYWLIIAPPNLCFGARSADIPLYDAFICIALRDRIRCGPRPTSNPLSWIHYYWYCSLSIVQPPREFFFSPTIFTGWRRVSTCAGWFGLWATISAADFPYSSPSHWFWLRFDDFLWVDYFASWHSRGFYRVVRGAGADRSVVLSCLCPLPSAVVPPVVCWSHPFRHLSTVCYSYSDQPSPYINIPFVNMSCRSTCCPKLASSLLFCGFKLFFTRSCLLPLPTLSHLIDYPLTCSLFLLLVALPGC